MRFKGSPTTGMDLFPRLLISTSFVSADSALNSFGTCIDHDTKYLTKTSSHCWAREKSFSVIPPSSCVVSFNVTLLKRMPISLMVNDFLSSPGDPVDKIDAL